MLIRRLRYWLGSAKREAALRAEMELHIEEKAAELRDRGMSESDARDEARRRFGNFGSKQEQSREIWIARCWSDFWQDLRYGARTLAAQPGFTGAAVVALVLGIGVNAVIFNVYNSLAFAPWAIRDAGETVQIWAERGDNWRGVSWPHFRYLQQHTQSLSGLAAFSGNEFRVTHGDASWDAEVVTTSENYFDVIGTGFAAGRGFSTAASGVRNPVAETVLQYETWLDRFGGDPDIVGTWIEIGGQRFRIVGVSARGFHGAAASQTHLWIPGTWLDILRPDRKTLDDPEACCISAIGRLRPGTKRARAQAEVSTLSGQFLAAANQPARRVRLTVPSFLANPARFADVSTIFLPIGVASLLILLLACANVSNLQLARATARRREIAVRLSLGASRGRILRQLLVESLLVSVLAGVASVAVSAWAARWMFHAIAGGEALTFRFENDFRVLAFILLATFAATLLFGLAPALNAVGGGTTAGMREGTRTTSTGRLRSLLLATQVALCVILLSGAALLVRTLDHVSHVDTGFKYANVIVMSTGLDTSGAGDEQGRALLAGLMARIAALPGVESVAQANTIPLDQNSGDTKVLDPRTNERVEVGISNVSASFFETLQIPVIAGRAFTPADEVNQSAVILNEGAAQRFWPGESAVGKTLQWARPVEVVGVVRNSMTHSFGSEKDPQVWLASKGDSGSTVLVRHSGPAEPLLKDLPKQARDLDRRFLASAMPYSETIARARRSSEISAATASVLGALCLLLACVGIYGVAAYNASQRTREMGIRMALGALPRAILKMVLKQNLLAVMVGATVGIAGAILFGRLLASWLYGVKPSDPLAMLVTIAIILGTSMLAVWGPARRSSRVDPAITLRHE